ncbi:MAG TPA: homocysteine S-methyltransferase family protein [Thermoclostridium sp.]|nr:homocysteine S-methyltransferase family protein [Thermoclostridium sp.]
MTKEQFREMVSKGIIILDGATGTLLQEQGMPTGVCPERWVLDNPHSIINIQKQYVDSGADILYTFSFGANELKLKEFNLEDVKGINRELAKLSRQASNGRALVAGDISMTGQLMEPFGMYTFEEVVNAYKKQVIGLLEGGVDLFVIETMMDIQEVRAALLAVKETCDLPIITTMTFERGGHTINGTDPLTALITLQSLGADAVGCNCSTGPKEMIEIIEKIKPYAKVPLVAKPNAGMPKLIDGKTVFDMGATEFIQYADEFIKAGVNLLGGCCGTTPEYILGLSKAARGKKASEGEKKTNDVILSSSRRIVSISNQLPTCLIGERINPTGKKKLRQELKEGTMDLVTEYAMAQIDEGALVLDVNAGVPGIDETKTLTEMVKTLSTFVTVPLCLDSSSPEALESALRVYPGRALINSISAEKSKIEKILPIAAKYGAAFILLPLDDNGVPEKAEDRIKVIESVYKNAKEYGYTKSDFLVDGLVMTAASNQEASLETMKVINWSNKEFGSNTVIGLSNISFGLPERTWINAAFLAMAMSQGLSAVIMNPASHETMRIKRATDVLTGKDKGSIHYIKTYGKKSGVTQERQQGAPVFNCVLDGRRNEIVDVVKQELANGVLPVELVDNHLVPAITRVGELYQEKTYFLPQLIQSAEAMEAAMSHLAPLLEDDKRQKNIKGKIILATVKGDIHDIGKNIVGLMLRNYGFDVIDLGKDVELEEIIKTAVDEKVDIIALSALMTTTMEQMQQIADKVKAEGIGAKILIGGAAVDESYATQIGAAYAKDAYLAVKKAEELLMFTDS